MNNTLKFMLCTMSCILAFNNGYSMDDSPNSTLDMQDEINSKQMQESDQEFLDRIYKKMYYCRRVIIREFYSVSYMDNIFSSLSDNDQQRFKKLVEEKTDLVLNKYPYICEFLIVQDPIDEKSQYIKGLLYKNSNNKKYLFYFLKHKLEEIATIPPKLRNPLINYVINIINKELAKM